ncbi:MAG: helix-turn-helix domain-containing protein [bacterium]|nr:helix-turn-helix domain-containing protein [bacterium]
MARASKYETLIKPDIPKIKKAVEAGATVEEIAKAYNIATSTLYKYQAEHSELKDAFARGREEIVIEIKAALLKKALGFTYTEEKVTAKRDKEGQAITNIETFHRYCPPSETAAGMLLRNYTDDWQDKDKQTAKLKQQEYDLREAIAEATNFDLDLNKNNE